MRFRYALLLFTLAPAAAAQPEQVELFPALLGSDLRSAVVAEYKPASVPSESSGKDYLYGTVWATEQGGQDGVESAYTGYFVPFDCAPSCDPSQDVFNNGSGINQEHVWPRSEGADGHQGERDLHHLFPTWVTANSDRASLPFAEIADADTDRWYVENTTTSTPPATNRDAYSELDQNTAFEVRETVKGDVARAMFYFYTMYEGPASEPFFEAQKETLLDWHYDDPVTAAEYDRTFLIAEVQSDEPNPFVLDSTLARRAYFPPATTAGTTAPLTGAELSQAYPNPFRAQTAFALRVERPQTVRVEVFDLLGRRVALLHDGAVAAGQPLRLTWDGSGAPAGLYVYRATGETFRATRRVTKAN